MGQPPPETRKSHVATKILKCSVCKQQIQPGERYWVLPTNHQRKVCAPCTMAEQEGVREAEEKGEKHIDGVPYPPPEYGTGFGRTQSEALENYMQINNVELEMIRINDATMIVPDEITRSSVRALALAQEFAHHKPAWLGSTKGWIVAPDIATKIKAAAMLLDRRIGSPIQRIVTKTIEQESEEAKLKRLVHNEDTIRVYAEYGVYTKGALVALVERCGGDPSLIPEPKRKFQQ